MKHLIAGNWKMNGSPASAEALATALASRADQAVADIAVCPPAPLLPAVFASVRGSRVAVGGQDCHANDKGAHTGDVSPVLLKMLGCAYVIVGHSERRADHGESDADVKAKAIGAHRAGLIPIICVGETEEERGGGKTAEVISRQVAGSVPADARAGNTVIAYEPVWAIGTGKTATLEDIAAVHLQIRDLFATRQGGAEGLRILYGGSVKAANAKDILATAHVGGALVGGASLDADEFWKIIESCPR